MLDNTHKDGISCSQKSGPPDTLCQQVECIRRVCCINNFSPVLGSDMFCNYFFTVFIESFWYLWKFVGSSVNICISSSQVVCDSIYHICWFLRCCGIIQIHQVWMSLENGKMGFIVHIIVFSVKFSVSYFRRVLCLLYQGVQIYFQYSSRASSP